MSFFAEMNRRNVFRVGVAYVVMAWLVLQVADVILGHIDTPDWVFSVVMLILAIGFPIVLVFAWVFELTPEGLKREKDIDRTRSITAQTGRKLNLITMIALALAVGYFFWESRIADRTVEPAAAPSRTSIAVLPFVNMSPDPDQDYFSDGISEEILNVLAQIPSLHVTSRSSAFQFKGENIDIPTVAQRLGVEHVLEGSVRRSGNRVRITAQLIEADSDRHLWSESYDRELTDIFAVQDEISQAIVGALQKTLEIEIDAPSRIVGTEIDPIAYNEYLQGVHYMELRGAKPLKRAAEHLERAVEIEPDYVPAMARLAMTYRLLPQYDDSLSMREFQDRASPFARRAYELDPESWEANLAMAGEAWDRGLRDGTQLKEARAFAKRAIELNPSHGTSYAWLATMTAVDGDVVESMRILEGAIEVDPLNRILLDNLTGAYIRRGRFDDARRTIERLTAVSEQAAFRRAAHLATAEGRWADNAIALLQSLAADPADSNYWARRIVADDLALPREALTIGDIDSYCELHMLYLDERQRTLNCIRENIEEADGPRKQFVAGIIAFHEGEIETAFETMDAAWRAFERSTSTTAPPIYIHAAVASGNLDRAQELVDELTALVGSRREDGIISATLARDQGMAYYLIGKTQEALPYLEQAVDEGLFIRTRFDYLMAFREDPDVQWLIERQAEKSAREQRRFLEIMCGEDNPVADFWAPSEAACSLLDGV